MSDIQELIGEARTAVRKLHPLGTSPMDDRVLALADALEALNTTYEKSLRLAGTDRMGLCNRVNELRAERDALQAQLDSMTTELRACRLDVSPKGKVIVGPLQFEERQVSPWVEVSS